jgi:SAM-dependent MidA family methyltransferase
MTRRIRALLVAAVALAAVLLSRPALAGPPLLCFPFDIGSMQSLPMGRGAWHATDPKYDVSHLVTDTLALLTQSAPLTLRMETIRRATIYASTHPTIAAHLMSELKKRSDAKAPLAAFDYGYLIEASRESEYAFSNQKSAIRNQQ